ncbi:MAG: FkbM family methyltransferase [Methylocystis sp.]|nr:FkbM family methyltransferase [Methylocystis sp.]
MIPLWFKNHPRLQKLRRARQALRGDELLNLDECVEKFLRQPTEADRRRFFGAVHRSGCGALLHAQASRETFIVDSADAYMALEMYFKGSSQFETVETAFELIASERGADLSQWTLIDIGANIGVISIPAVARGMCARAIAIEPTPKTARLLRANVALNGLEDRIDVHEVALSDKNGFAQLELSRDNSGDNRLAADARECAYDENNRARITVPQRRFDDLFSDLDMSRCLAWIDVQGFEAAVLAGATKIADNKIPIVIELWPYGLRRIDAFPKLYDALHRYERFRAIASYDGPCIDKYHPISELPELWARVAAEKETFGLDLLVL